jgi:hypothetical protein
MEAQSWRLGFSEPRPGEFSDGIHFESLHFLQFTPQTLVNLGITTSTKPLENAAYVHSTNPNTKDSPLQPINGKCAKVRPMKANNDPLLYH